MVRRGKEPGHLEHVVSQMVQMLKMSM